MKQLFWHDTATIDFLKIVLKKGEIVLAQGDTVLGLLADVSELSYKNLDALKNRSNKPYLILVSDYKKALGLIEITNDQLIQFEKIMKICWPGPVTLIFKAKEGLPFYFGCLNGTVAIRVPDHQGLLELLQHFDGLLSTSANKSGEAIPATISEVDEDIKAGVAGIIRNDNDVNSLLPSTILDCTKDTITVVRQGEFPIEKLADFLE